MATIKVLNASQVNPEAPVEIKLGIVNEPDKPIQYVGIPGPQGKDGKTGPQGPKGDTPVKGIDYFTPQDIAAIAAQVPVPEVDLTDYASKSFVETAIRGAETGLLKRSIVQSLPQSEIDDNTIYMVPKIGDAGDVYDEYLYVNNTWEHIGSTDVDLTGYATEQYVNNSIAGINSLKRPVRLIETQALTFTSYQSFDGDYSQTSRLAMYQIFQTDEDWEWFKNYLQYGWYEYPCYFRIGPEAGENEEPKAIWKPWISRVPYETWTKDMEHLANLFYSDKDPFSSTLSLDVICGYTNEIEYQWLRPRNFSTLVEYQAPKITIRNWSPEGRELCQRLSNSQLTAGPGIVISGGIISATAAEYLTNSDILAIWNGTN